MIAGLDRPTSGTVVVHGEDLGRLTETGLALFRRRRIGMVFQFFNLLDDLPALDNVALAAQLAGAAPRRPRRAGAGTARRARHRRPPQRLPGAHSAAASGSGSRSPGR